MKTENLPLLRERLEKVISEAAPEETFLPSMEYDLTVPFRTWTRDSMAWLTRLEPTGCGPRAMSPTNPRKSSTCSTAPSSTTSVAEPQ